jgi:Fe-S cluster assembly protein SufD
MNWRKKAIAGWKKPWLHNGMKHLEKQFSTIASAEHEPQSLKDLRNSAFDSFKKTGFPKKNWEAWRFTTVADLVKTPFRLSTEADLPEVVSKSLDYLPFPTLLFVNGHYQPDESTLPKGINVNTLIDSYNEDAKLVTNGFDSGSSPFTVLNTAMMNSGLHIRISEDFENHTPIRFLYLTTKLSEPIMNHPRLILDMADNAQANIIEEYRGDSSDSYWNNAVTVIRTGNNSKVHHVRIQNEAPAASHLATTIYEVLAKGAIHGCFISAGAALYRNDVNVTLLGERADVTLNGLCLSRETQHMDHNITVDHTSEHVTSRMLFKYILAEKSSAVFNGRAVVRSDAQKTDADQTNKNLLLGNDALMYSNPQLEIYADDVRCTHGSSTGQISEDALFYLRSRGLDAVSAKALLINGFANEVVDDINNEEIRDYTRRLFESWLSGVTHG